MPAERPAPTVTDYLVAALSPVLVMLLIGSLVFFLVEVLYQGQYTDRLLYTLFFFVVGAVLVARIGIELGGGRAGVYGLVLGAVTYLALLRYVEYPGGGMAAAFGWLINLGLLLLVGLSAYKLTWDCTHIDEERKGSGRGVLAAAGLDADATEGEGHGLAPPADRSEASGASGGHMPGQDRLLPGGSARGQRGRHSHAGHERHRQAPHTPGVWVVYFALAALPLFALGQSLVPIEDADRRRATFWHTTVFIGSSLGLLVTTSLLGLRRYLRQRRAAIPWTLSGGWLLTGGGLITVFLILGALLPRPHTEMPWFGLKPATSQDRQASRYAVRRDAAGRGEGASGATGEATPRPTTHGQDTNTAADRPTVINGRPPNPKDTGGPPGSGSRLDQSGEPGPAKTKTKSGRTRGPAEAPEGPTPAPDRSDPSADPAARATAADTHTGRPDPQRGDRGDQTSGAPPGPSGMTAAVEAVAGVLKWIVFTIVAVLVAVAAVLAGLRWLAPFTGWAQWLLESLRTWWSGAWGRGDRAGRPGISGAEESGPRRPPPFAAFPHPWAGGSGVDRSAAELVAYTFDALDAWAWDHDGGRRPGETPLEFLTRLQEEHPDLAGALAPFATVYARTAYSAGPPPADTPVVVRRLWAGLSAAADPTAVRS